MSKKERKVLDRERRAVRRAYLRYGENCDDGRNYRHKYVCLTCRRAYREPGAAAFRNYAIGQDLPKPTCPFHGKSNGFITFMFEVPRKRDLRAWREIVTQRERDRR